LSVAFSCQGKRLKPKLDWKRRTSSRKT